MLDMPPPRFSHSVADFTEKEKIIFGGFSSTNNQILNDVWIFNFEKISLNSTSPEIPGAFCQVKEQSGDVPSGRFGHSCLTINKKMFVVGGKT